LSTTTSANAYARRSARPITEIVVYGRRWCALSQMVRRYLDRLGIPYEYVDLDLHPEVEARLSWMTGGHVRTPTVYLGDEVLVQPTIRELEWELTRKGL
jgi:mycoredoxin